MRLRDANLDEHDLEAFRATFAFLHGRLEDRATIDWALRLAPRDAAKRSALRELIDSRNGRAIREPWRSAWRLIEESWSHPVIEEHISQDEYYAHYRLQAGERSGSLVSVIVEHVAPRLTVTAFSDLHLESQELPKRPKTIDDLFSARLTSGNIVDPSLLMLGELTERPFLVSLAHALDAAVISGLDIARRIGWDEKRSWRLGRLYRVYYVPPSERSDDDNEPDEFNHGIAPSVKLLHAVVARLVDVDISSALAFVARWKLTDSPVHLRLWAALSRDPRVTPADEVGASMQSLDDRRFWNLHDYPEIAELRARRFSELNSRAQAALITRIRRSPPRKGWRRYFDTDRLEVARVYWAVRELRRIELAGAVLPKRDKAWLDARIKEFQDLVQMRRLDEGFSSGPQARWLQPNPDNRYDSFAGEERLGALETALSAARRGWDDDPAERAGDWIRQPNNHVKVLLDLESLPDGGAAFARVWERFGWSHSPETKPGDDATQRDLQGEGGRVLTLLTRLPEATVRQAIDGISQWLSAWEKQIVRDEGLNVWLRLWPIAVEATNATKPLEEAIPLDSVNRTSDDSEPMDLDTLNTPVGKFVGVFLAACPTARLGDEPFREGNAQRLMRDAIEGALGSAGSIVKYRLIEQMPYFLAADESWTRKHLVPPLLSDRDEVQVLWRAVARQRMSFKVMATLGDAMADRAIDQRLSRDTRRALAFRVVIECLHAFKNRRDPAVPIAHIQQMIRLLDDEVRVYAAEAVQRFVQDVSAPREGEQPPPSPEQLFQSSAAPFFQQVWPQERFLATPSVSRALADLPATSGEAFAEAVRTIERFLLPFDCWSMAVYGLHGEVNGRPKLSIINNQGKAEALLRLLDLTVGTEEGSNIPHDLPDALHQIRTVAPSLLDNPAFRRLATAARRK
jgi:hypothetical protein